MNRTLLAALALLLPLTAQAVPFHLTNQGRLVDEATGEGLQGAHELTFSLYTDADATEAALWRETREVDLVGGTYSVVLGLQEPLSEELLDQYPLFLGLSVDGGAEMLPRYEVSSVPYAILAESAVTAGHAETAAQAETATHLEGGSVDATSLSVNGQVVVDEDGAWGGEPPPPADLGCSDGQVQAWDGDAGAWACATLPTTISVLDCAEGEGPVYDEGDDLWTCGAEADPLYTASPASGISEADLAAWTAAGEAFAAHGSHAEAGYLTSYTETDPHFSDAPAAGIGAGDIAGWTAAAEDLATHGSHAEAGYLTSYSETDPAFTEAPAAGITAADLDAWNAVADDFAQHGSHAAAGYLTSDADPAFTVPITGESASFAGPVAVGTTADGCGTGNVGAIRVFGEEHVLQYCDGTEWIHVAGPIGRTSDNPGASCDHILANAPGSDDGAYWIDPDGAGAFEVWCDMETDGGGWTLVMKQASGSGPGSPLSVGTFGGWSGTAQPLIDAADATLGDANMVNPGYYRLSGEAIRMTSASQWRREAEGAWIRTIATTAYDALHDDHANQSGPLDGAETTPWSAASFTDHTDTTADPNGSSLCFREGRFFNRTDWQYTDGGIKWGWAFNNECTRDTTDTTEGLGCCGNTSWYRASPWPLFVWVR